MLAANIFISSFFVDLPFVSAAQPAYYYLAPWEWVTEGGLSFWQAPQADKLLGSVDLRPLPAHGRSGGVPEGYGFFSYNQQVVIPDSIYLGDSLDATVSPLVKAQIRRDLNITGPIQSSTVRDILWDILTIHSDPTGQTGPKPLRGSLRSPVKLYLGSDGVIKQESFNN